MTAATGFELALQSAAAALQAAGIAVLRHPNGDEVTVDACPLVILSRRGTRRDAGAPLGREYHQFGLQLECCVAADAWETAADEFHARVHAALVAAPLLSAWGIELSATEPDGRGGADTVGRLQALYTLTPTLGADLQPA